MSLFRSKHVVTNVCMCVNACVYTYIHTYMGRGRQHSFVEIDHGIFSSVILSLPPIQEGQLSVSGERMCTIPVNRLED